MARRLLPSVGLALLLAVAACSDRPAAPGNPEERSAGAVIDALLALWAEARLVCLGEEHGSRADARLRSALVADPRFAATVDVVLVEWASPLHQDLVDRLVLDGEPLSRDTLRPLWLDAGLGEVWESPPYEGLLRALRAVNLTLPRDERVRVVAGAVAVDWASIERPEELVPFLDRRELFARRAAEAVLRPGLRGLALYGALHCERSGPGFPAALPPALAARVRSVLPLYPATTSVARRSRLGLGPYRRIVPVTGTPLAAEPAEGLLPFAGRSLLGQLADALLWHGEGTDEILARRPGELPVEWRRELDRRARLWRAARASAPAGSSR